MKAKDLMGRKVYDKDAIEVGKISDFEINTSTFAIEKIYIKSGLTTHNKTEPDKIDRIGDTIILLIPKGELK
ncbi:MAG: PRC-barrel domain-containing protein [Candidatus Methanofastidiosia archaeon]|jgi:sporulation protein YlmC with PRC-barrel domain